MGLEGLTLVFHLVITICVIAAYLYTVAIGRPDETLQSMALLAAGFWFGAASGGAQKIKDIVQKRRTKTPGDGEQ